MKRIIIITLTVCLLTLSVFGAIYIPGRSARENRTVRVGLIYENDEATPYTHNFARVQLALEREYGSQVQIRVRTNVLPNETEEPLNALLQEGCDIVFAYTHSEQVMPIAAEHPETQFCQISRRDTVGLAYPENYHTFKAEVYQSRYVCGIVAGMKLRELIDTGAIAADQALVGFVGANQSAEVLSAATAFLLGVRSVAPEAVMRIRCTDKWCSYAREKACAKALIDEGCVIITQHTQTYAPALVCEEAAQRQVPVYYIGQDEDMLDIAPTASLISARIDWSHYVLGAVEAVLSNRPIERVVKGHIHGNDISAGFDQGWVEMLDLNRPNAAPGTQAAVDRAVEALRKGSLEVFKGHYTGTSPVDHNDTIDLSVGWAENARTSSPTFRYLLDGIVTVEA